MGVTFAGFTLQQFLDALANSEPTPGGGTASAITGAMGASLLVMVTGLAKSKSNTDEEKAALAGVRAPLSGLRDRLVQLADDDSASFDDVMAAYRLPKSNDAEKSTRAAAVERALQHATAVPLDTLRECVKGMELALVVAKHGNRSATSDVGVAIGLLEAAAAGAEANVKTNLASLKDEAFKSATAAETSSLAAALATCAANARGQR